MKEIKVGDKFEYTNYLGEKSIHTIKNIINDGEGSYIIAEDGKDYGYIGEKDKKFNYFN